MVIRADKEIILSAGGFNTPKILQLSGIGDEADLKAVNIKTLVNATEVGKNVQDHILHGGCLYEPAEAIPYANSAANASGYYKTDASLELPDVSVVQIEIPYASPEIAKEYAPPQTAWALVRRPGYPQEPRHGENQVGQSCRPAHRRHAVPQPPRRCEGAWPTASRSRGPSPTRRR